MEEYLKQKHAETYMGTDDSMPDAFYDWLEILDTDELIAYADEFKTLAEQSLVGRVKGKLDSIKRWVFTAPYGLEIDEKNSVIPRKRGDDEYLKFFDILSLPILSTTTPDGDNQ